MSSNKTKARPSGPSVVVEIGNDWLKIAHAVPHRGTVALQKLHLQRFETLDGSVSKAISDAFKRLKLPQVPVLGCLPRQAVNVRMLELPSTDPAEIADMVDLQVGKQTPYSKDEIVSDYRIVPSDRDGYSRIVLAIVQRSVLRQRFSILEEAGVDVRTMSVSSEGLLSWARSALPPQGLSAILDVDSFYSDLSIVSGGQLLFTRSILVGANQLLENGDRWREKIAQEIQGTFETFRGESGGGSPDSIVLTGAGGRIDGLAEHLGEQLAIPSSTLDSLRSVSRRPAEPAVGEGEFAPVSLTAVIGMAMAPQNLQFNLIPDSVRLRKNLSTKATSMATLGILLMAVLVAASLLANVRVFLLRERLSDLRAENMRTGPQAAEVLAMQDAIGLIGERQSGRLAAVSLLKELHGWVPENVLLDGLSFERAGEGLVLDGTASQRRDISRFIKALEGSRLFRDVHEGGSTTVDSQSGKYKFQIVCSLERES